MVEMLSKAWKYSVRNMLAVQPAITLHPGYGSVLINTLYSPGLAAHRGRTARARMRCLPAARLRSLRRLPPAHVHCRSRPLPHPLHRHPSRPRPPFHSARLQQHFYPRALVCPPLPLPGTLH